MGYGIALQEMVLLNQSWSLSETWQVEEMDEWVLRLLGLRENRAMND